MQEGAVIGDRFEVGPLAGKGSMGAVFRAYDRAAGKPVAIKVLSQHDADAVRRFDHEARVLAELAHPHIVQHVAHGAMANGTPYLVMEWLEGQSLAARLKQSRLIAADALELAQHIASALAAAHTRGIVHRDIKPSNIFLVNGSVHASRVLDFGVAQVANAGPRQTRTGGVVGTPGYMAPEQIQGSRERATPRVDIFSLGALLFECLTGRRAFEGDDVMAILARVLREEAPRVRSVLPDVPEELDTLVAQMLSRVPEARPANGTQVHRALQQVGRRISTHVHDEPRGSRLRIELETRLLGIILAAPIEEAAERQSAPTLRTNVSPAQGEKLQQLAMRHGGLATEFAGGGLLVRVLGTDALVTRAARCALAVAKVLEGFRITLVVGCADDGRDLPHAELIGRAIQLLQYSDRHKASHGVRLDATTVALLDAHFSIMGPSHAPRLCHEQSDFGTPRLLFDKPPPFTGRKREIDTLVDFLTEALDEGDAATALVVAHAGMGKSRLGREALVELRQRIPHLSVAIARAVPTELPHSLVRDLVRHVLQLGPEAPRDRIHAALQNTLPDARTATIDMLTQFFAEPTESSEALPWAPMEHARQAWLELLGALARGRSMLLVLEDAQWADDASMELLQDALAQVDMHPFGVLALARPEIRERGFGLFHRRDVQEMRLGPLSPKMSTTFVNTFLPENSNLGETIVLASEGHPMFLEELIRTSNPDTTPQISCAVLLAAHGPQFARIAEDELQALRLASLVGVTFWIG
ncbi:MAG TPA: protein kinase, partial [Polyangium sp.]|nr:protein kinase [Polyangium sp.]